MELKNKKKLKNFLLSVIVLILFVILILPRLLGYEMIHVISGSMEPAIMTDSLIIVKPEDPSMLMAGDIITFKGGLSKTAIITHRVVENQKDVQQIITKGDANDQEDRKSVGYSEVIGKVMMVVPFAGKILSLMAAPAAKAVLIGGIVILFILRKR